MCFFFTLTVTRHLYEGFYHNECSHYKLPYDLFYLCVNEYNVVSLFFIII